GVAVYVGVALANDSARRAFELSSEAVTGRTTHRLLPVGGALPESVYTELVTQLGVTNAAPVIEAAITVATDPPRRLTLLGVDPLKEPAVRGFVGWLPGRSGDAVRLLTEPGAVLLPESLDEIGSRDVELRARVDGRAVTVLAGGTGRAGTPAADRPGV